MTYKHQQKQKLKKELERLSTQLKSFLIYSGLLRKVNLAVKSISKVIDIRHSKKLLKVQQSQKQQKKITNFGVLFEKKQYIIFHSAICLKTNMMRCRMVLITIFLEILKITKLTQELNFFLKTFLDTYPIFQNIILTE